MYEKIMEKKEGKADAGKDSEAEGVLSRGKTHYIVLS
jgi:alcohol dehydrogenase